MIIREANAGDILELARLRWDFSPDQVAAARQTREAFIQEFALFVTEALSAERWKIWVADSENRLIGNLYLELIPKLPRPGEFGSRFAYMTNVYVEENVRNGGIGGRLMDAAVAWAMSSDMEFIVVWPSEESVGFYERRGFRGSEAMVRFLK